MREFELVHFGLQSRDYQIWLSRRQFATSCASLIVFSPPSQGPLHADILLPSHGAKPDVMHIGSSAYKSILQLGP